MEQLQVSLGAEIKDFQSKLAKSLKILDNLKNNEKELTKAFKDGKISSDKYYSSIASNTTRLSKISKLTNTYKSEINGLGNNLSKAKTKIASGNSAMTAFSRTIQDAPFGIMGVSNNITNLTEQFGYLKNKTGSAGGALKAMTKDLLGFGGITLAISVVTSLMLVYDKEIKKLLQSSDKLKIINKELAKSFATVSVKSIVEFKTLTKVLTDTTSSQKDQAKAVQTLKEKYSDFDTAILTTKGNYEKGKIAIDAYIGSLVKQARAKAALTLIEEKSSKILVLKEEKIAKIREKGFEDEKTFNSKLESEQKRVDKIESGRKKSKESELLNSLKRIRDTNKKEIKDYEEQITNLTKLADVKDLVLYGDKGYKSKKVSKSNQKDVFVDTTIKDYKEGKQEIQELISTDPLDLSDEAEWGSFNTINWEEYFANQKLNEQIEQTKAQLMKFNEGVSSLITGTISSTFSQLGQSISEAMANGGDVLQSIGNSLLSSLGGFLSKLGSMMIEYGTMAIIKGKLDLAIAAGGPIAIGAGIAAIAVGTALTAIGGAMGSFSSSGGSSNASSGSESSYSRGSSTSYSGSSSSGGGTYVFEIQGTKLVGVLKNTLNRNKNLGGTFSLAN